MWGADGIDRSDGFHHYGAGMQKANSNTRPGDNTAQQDMTRSADMGMAQALATHGHGQNTIKQYRTILALDSVTEEMARHRAVLAVDAYDMSALNGMGKALWSIGRNDEAMAFFRSALTHEPTSTETARNLVQMLVEGNNLDEAIACYRAVLEHDPSLYAIHAGTAMLLRKAGRHVQARDHLEQACALQPRDERIHAMLSLVLQELGDINAAAAHLRQAIANAPDEPNYYLGLARLSTLTANDPALAAMKVLARREDTLDEQGRMRLHFALGKALADSGEHRVAFEHLLKANALRRAGISYNEEQIARGAKAVRERFTAEIIAETAATGHPSPRPVFIVGMPRSGSTLVEQILASHPQVYGAGEVSVLTETLQDAAKRFPDWKAGNSLAGMDRHDRHAIAEDYLQRLDGLAQDWTGAHPPTRISNKLLGNFFHIGIIRQLWPNAQIIHSIRDPIDTCLSCFSIPFDSLDFTFDLGELGRYHHQYQEQMAHWRQVLPAGAILDIRYEDIVEDLEASARRIIAYCGLPWDESCLRFYESRRLVTTSSAAQVRRPIYRSAVGRWRPDDEVLKPLLDGLKGLPAQPRSIFL